MSSFDDVQEVDIDYGDGTFTIVRNNGSVHTYYFNQEPELFNNLIQYADAAEWYEIGEE